MDWVFKLEADLEAANPADHRPQGIQTLEPDPDMLVQRGALDEFRFAAKGRNIEDFDAIAAMSRASKRDLRGQPKSDAPARILVGPCPAVEHGTSPSMRPEATAKMINQTPPCLSVMDQNATGALGGKRRFAA